MYPSAYNHNLSLRATGRIGDGRFSLITNSGTSQGRGFGPLHNGTFTYERAGGQKFTGGDFSTGTDLLFMSAAVRGVSAEIPVAGMTVKAFGGRSISGAYESQPVYTDPNLAQQQLQPNIRATGRFGYDTNVGGAYVAFGPTSDRKSTRLNSSY